MDFYFHVAERALQTTLSVAGPILAVALFVGLGVGLVQAVTQVQEQTLAFIPKLLAMAALLFLAGPYLVEEMTSLVRFVAEAIAQGPRP